MSPRMRRCTKRVDVAPAVIGLDPRCHDRVQDAMDSVLTGHAAAKTAIDVACWDAHGKSAGCRSAIFSAAGSPNPCR